MIDQFIRSASRLDQASSQCGKIIGLVPAYCPALELVEVVDYLLRRSVVGVVYVIDDGSPSSYGDIFAALTKVGAIVVRHNANLGKGMALKTGLRTIVDNHPESNAVVTFDADGQHLSDDISRVVNEGSKGGDALVIGARNIPSSAPWRSKLGNKVTSLVMTMVTGIKLNDTQSGLRLIPHRLIHDLLNLKASGYEFELDALFCAIRQSLPIRTCRIKGVYFDGNKSSHFNPVTDSVKIYLRIAVFVLSSLKEVIRSWIRK